VALQKRRSTAVREREVGSTFRGIGWPLRQRASEIPGLPGDRMQGMFREGRAVVQDGLSLRRWVAGAALWSDAPESWRR